MCEEQREDHAVLYMLEWGVEAECRQIWEASTELGICERIFLCESVPGLLSFALTVAYLGKVTKDQMNRALQ